MSRPIVGYNYFLLHLHEHIGNCARRKAAMEYLYNFYHSDVVENIAVRLGYAVVPDFIRHTIIDHMIANLQCSNGEYALDKFRLKKTTMLSTAAFAPTLSTYLSSYHNLDPTLVWDLSTALDSYVVWKDFMRNPDQSLGIFTMFHGKEEKLRHFNDPRLLTSTFAHIAVAIIYRLDNLPATIHLQVTPSILAGIFSGKVKYWNDSSIQAANMEHKMFLPHKRINVVLRGSPSDTNAVLIRYLATVSEAFKTAYDLNSPSSNFRTVNFSRYIEDKYLEGVSTNDEIDAAVTANDGSIGYYLHLTPPNSDIAALCISNTPCNVVYSTNTEVISESYRSSFGGDAGMPILALLPNDRGVSIHACDADPAVNIRAYDNVITHDITLSTARGCYPLVGTVDMTIFRGQSSSCAASEAPDTSYGNKKVQENLVNSRVNFVRWIFGDSHLIKPLHYNSIAPSSSEDRDEMFRLTCDIGCHDVSLGYSYCGYRDCLWDTQDFQQVVSRCDQQTATRTVTYQTKEESTCLKSNTATFPPTGEIECEYVPSQSAIGAACYSFFVLSTVTVVSVLILTVIQRRDKLIRRSQPIFVYIFLSGAILINFSILVLLGPNTNITCLARPWIFNLCATIMIAPLIVKLYRVDAIFNNPSLKKVVITNLQIGSLIIGALVVDVIILTLWTVDSTPEQHEVMKLYANVMGYVADAECSHSDLTNKYEIVMLVYKCLQVGYAIRMVSNISVELACFHFFFFFLPSSRCSY